MNKFDKILGEYREKDINDGSTAGQVPFWNGIGLAYPETSELVWDDVNKNLGIGTSTPLSRIHLEDSKASLLYAKRTDFFDFVQYRRNAGTWVDITAEAGTSQGTVSGDVLDAIGDTFIIGKANKFSDIYIDVGTARSATGTFIWEYSLGSNSWSELTVTDGTNYLLNDGVVSFTPPVDWATDSQNSSAQLYFVRLRVDSGTFSTEPTVFLVVPNNGQSVVEIYANGGDILPAFSINRNGNVSVGLSPTSTNTNRFYVLGTAQISQSLTLGSGLTVNAGGGYAHSVGSSLVANSDATALIPNQNSPVARFTSRAWNGSASRLNAMDIYVNPDSEPVTAGRMAFKNTTIDGIADASELMNLDSNGRLNILGRAQATDDMFDRVFQYVGTTWTDITLSVSSFGLTTGDVLNVVNDFVYIGKEDQFSEMYFDFGTIMSSGTSRLWQYWDGSTWATLVVTDGTSNWANDGSATFTPPVDWAKGTVNNVTDLYWVRVGTVSGTFTVEPTLRVLLPNTMAITKEVLSNNMFDGTTGWIATGDYAYTINDYTFTYSSGVGTLRQAKENFNSPLEPNTWYRFRYTVGVAAPTGTLSWIGEEIAIGKTYFTGSTTEVDVFFKTNANPGDFVIYTTATTTSGFRLDNVYLKKLENGRLYTSGDIRCDGVFRGNGTKGIKINSAGNVGIGTETPSEKLHIEGAITQGNLSADPDDPDDGKTVQWVSDGTGAGDPGDVMMKINVGGTVKTITLVDYSEV